MLLRHLILPQTLVLKRKSKAFTYPTNNPGQADCGCDESESRIAPRYYSDKYCRYR